MALNNEVAVECLDVTYRLNRRHLVEKLNFKVFQGEILVLLGRSGSGKTTTMKLINNLLTPSCGEKLAT
jgi:osmoprotectant transport system ATP-binding protein